MTLFKTSKTPAAEQMHDRSFGGGYFTSPNQLIPTRPPWSTGGHAVTASTALTKVALLSGVNLIADMPRILDVSAWTKQGSKDKRKVPLPTNVSDPEGLGYGLSDFAYKYVTSRILRGNVFIRVDKVDGAGRPQVCTILNPDDVVVRRDTKTGRYTFHSPGGGTMHPFMHQPEGGIIHRRANPQPGQVLGLSVISNHARTLGLALGAEQFGADFFADGAHPSSILTTDQAVSEDQAKTIKARFVNAIRGSREPAVLGAGVRYHQVQIAPNESQFLETQKFTASEVCRMIGPGVAEMLGYETGGTMMYQNVQSRSLHLLIYTVDKWLKDLELLFAEHYLPRSQFVEFDRMGILRMVPQDRWKVHKDELQLAARTINEVRAEEGYPPVEWGDEPFLPTFGSTGTAAAQHLQLDAGDGEVDGEVGKQIIDVKGPPKIGGIK